MKKKRLKGRFTEDDPVPARTVEEKEEREQEEIDFMLADDII